MGYMCHHAIVVTGVELTRHDPKWDHATLAEVHAKAAEIFPWVSPLSPLVTNSHRSFFIPPDGSKEGWDTSDEGDRRRDEFIAWMKASACYSDGSSSIDWVEVQFGDDVRLTVVTRDSDSGEGEQGEGGVMKVYVVEQGCYAQQGVAGIYATAEAAMAAHPVPREGRRGDPRSGSVERPGGWREDEENSGHWTNGLDMDEHCSVTPWAVEGA